MPVIGSEFSRSRAAALTGAAAAGAAAVWAVGVERYLYKVRRHTLPVLKPGAAPVRVLHVSDLHLAPWQQKKIEWIRSLAELNPDVVVLTGDQLGHRDAISPLIDALQPLSEAAAETVFVHGSNDYYGPRMKNPAVYLGSPKRAATRTPDLDTDRLTARMLDTLGATDLNNTAGFSRVRDTDILWLGLNDPHIRYHDIAALREALANAAAADPARADSALRLGVVHAPYAEVLDELCEQKSTVIFSGHTHGGQLRVPGVGALVSNCDLPLAQTRGLSVWYTAENSSFLNVSAGVGTSIYAPARFACCPEVTLLTLTAAG